MTLRRTLEAKFIKSKIAMYIDQLSILMKRSIVDIGINSYLRNGPIEIACWYLVIFLWQGFQKTLINKLELSSLQTGWIDIIQDHEISWNIDPVFKLPAHYLRAYFHAIVPPSCCLPAWETSRKTLHVCSMYFLKFLQTGDIESTHKIDKVLIIESK